MRFSSFVAIALVVAASSAPAAKPDSLDAAARDYVRLQLAIGEKEAGYIDAYYGPEALRADGKALAAHSSLGQLQQQAVTLRSRIERLPGDARRKRFLAGELTAAVTRLRMLSGEKLTFDQQAAGLFGLHPKLAPLSSYDPVLADIARLVPGTGDLADRVDSYQDRFVIPTDRLRPVMNAAIAGCKARTLRHIALPPGENFTLSFVTGKTWGGYNYYLGNYQSRIEVNTDLPVRISRAIDLGCHEGYPGHHVLNSLFEQRLTRGKGWVEFSVYPLFSPQSVIAEGSANYGIDLAFPGAEKVAFEASKLYPLAGLPPAEAKRYDALLDALKKLSGARMTIGRDFLDGRISEQQAVDLTRKYGLASEARARQSIAFDKQYGAYILNYGSGQEAVKADVESRHGTAARWKRFEEIISEPTVPSDLKPITSRRQARQRHG